MVSPSLFRSRAVACVGKRVCNQTTRNTGAEMMGDAKTHYEVIVVGAGVAGIYQIKRLVDLGIDATVLESGADLGGTWFWNRYPGCRFDSESYTYGFSFSRELLDEWHWKERFSGQPENLRYLNYVADKFDLRKHMQFNCKVEAMHFDEARDLCRRPQVDKPFRGSRNRPALRADHAATGRHR
jgi:choline dehydrogenase-like flavoprotein